MGPGAKLGDFVLQEKIGEGSYGAVWRARQETLRREAVVKILHARHHKNETARTRFLREARLASRLAHPSAAHIYAFGAEPDGTSWIAMELVRGAVLTRHLPLDLPRTVALVDRIADVLAAAHEQGIVHRDLKPDNVMVLDRGDRLEPKLLDFGLARVVSAPVDEVAATLEPADDADVHATRAGSMVGTPLYMAPEQWLPDGVVDARTDQYALAVVIWSCLMGKPPFTGTMVEVGRKHLSAPLPTCGNADVDRVLARGAAKEKDDRYAGVLELAGALRAAAGLAGPAPLPPLPEPLRAAIASAPQPIAEAVAALEAARNPHQALDAARTATQALFRYLAALALVGGTRAARSGDALPALRRRAPDGDEWLALLSELLQDPGAVFPVPELAALFAAGVPAALRPRGDSDASGDADPHARLVAELDELAARLAALPWLATYTLVVPRDDGSAERWMGPRRLARALVTPAPAGARPTPSHPTLLDPDGRPVLDLWPVAQVAAPAPGAPEELFLLAGPGRRGARLVASPVGVERDDPEVWDWLSATLDESAERDGAAEDAPWRGLRAYTLDDAASFFGREEEAQALANRARVERFLAVVGPSGSGKSSLVQAGVVAALGEDWRVRVIRPGLDPLAELPGEQDLLIVDQLEEIFTLTHDDETRRLFAERLAAVARSSRVIVTLRDDFLARLHQLPALRDRLAAGVVLVATPAPADLLRILLEPARRAGYAFEDPELPRAMVADVAARPGALALLSFTAASLWERRDRHFRQLLRKAYDGMGGVGGALAAHAEETLAGFPSSAARRVREAFRQLVTAEGTRAVMARAELAPICGEDVLERLIGARLLTASDEGRVEIVHEALLDAWPRLGTWRREDVEGARMRDQLRAASRTWEDRGRPRDLLWRGDALAEFRAWRGHGGGAMLTPIEEQFTASAQREAARGRRLLAGLIGGALVVLAVVAVVMFVLSRRAQSSAAEARSRLIDSLVDQGRQALLAGDAPRALEYLRQAKHEGADDPVVRFLVARGLDALAPERRVLDGKGFVRAVALTPDGRRALSASVSGGDKTHLIVWDPGTGSAIAETDMDEAWLLSAALTPDGQHVIAGGREAQAAWLWNVGGAAPLPLPHDGIVVQVIFSPDGAHAASASADKTVKIWSVPSGALERTIAHDARVERIAFSPDGARLLSATTPGDVQLWDVATGQLVRRVAAPAAGAKPGAIAFTPNGKLALVARGVGATIYDLETGGLRASFGHGKPLTVAAVSADGATFATGSEDGTTRLWDASGTLQFVLAHADRITDVRFCGPHRVVTASIDRTARVWEVATGRLVSTLATHRDSVRSVACDASGHTLVSGSLDGTMRVWDLDASLLRSRTAIDGILSSVVRTADGARVVVARTDGRIAVVDRAGIVVATLDTGAVENDVLPYAAPLPDGRLVVCNRPRGSTSLWSVAGERLATWSDAQQPRPTFAAIAPDGARVVTTAWDSPEVLVWDVASGRVATRLVGHEIGVVTAAFDAAGQRMVSAGFDRALRVWNLAAGGAPLVLRGHTNALAGGFFRDDGFIVSAGNDNSIRLWDSHGELVRTAESSGYGITTVGPAPGGLVTVLNDESVEIWDLDHGRLLYRWQPHAGPVVSFAWLDDETLATAGRTDGTLAIWSFRR